MEVSFRLTAISLEKNGTSHFKGDLLPVFFPEDMWKQFVLTMGESLEK